MNKEKINIDGEWVEPTTAIAIYLQVIAENLEKIAKKVVGDE